MLISITDAELAKIQKSNALIRATYPEVRTFEETKGKAGVYCTNQRILNLPKGNRGSEFGFIESKVLAFNKMKANSEYLKDLEVILVNSNGDICEGNNRYESAMRRGEYVKFCVIEGHSEKLQSTDASVRLTEMATFSTMSSRWSVVEHFNSAFSNGSPLAILINQYYTSTFNRYEEDGKIIFTFAKLYHLLDLYERYSGANTSITKGQFDDGIDIYEKALKETNILIYRKVFTLANLLRKYGGIMRPEKVIHNLFTYMESEGKDKLVMLDRYIANAKDCMTDYVRKNGFSFSKKDLKSYYFNASMSLITFVENKNKNWK